MFFSTRVAFLDSLTIAEIVYVMFNLVARLMLNLYMHCKRRGSQFLGHRGDVSTLFSEALLNKFYCAFMLSLVTNRDHSE